MIQNLQILNGSNSVEIPTSIIASIGGEPFLFGDKMATMRLHSGELVLLDQDDYSIYSQKKWQLSPTGYVARSSQSQGVVKRVYLHRLIMDCPIELVIDHINKNRLDNRKSNLRICTQRENIVANLGWKYAEVKYKGVSYMSSGGKKILYKFRARIKDKHIGVFNSPEEAARAYDQEAKKLHGEYAHLNFPDQNIARDQNE
jgi:hypothetical protein